MKLSRKLPLGFAAVTLVVACAGFFGMSRMNHALDTYNDAVAQSGHAQRVEGLLSHFRLQTQEWKNTLLRGKDEAQRAKYWDAFQKSETEVAREAKDLISVLPAGEVRDLLGRFGGEHAKMGEGYRRGYADFTSSGFDAAAGDTAVKGMDRAPAELLAQAQEAMSKQAVATVAAAEAVGKQATILSYSLMLLGAIAAVVAGVLVTR